MITLRNIFRRRSTRSKACEPARLIISGIAPAPITPEPDEAEIAAEALLNSKCKIENSKLKETVPQKGTPDYYHHLSKKICEAHAAETRAALRYISYTEQSLKSIASSDNLGGSLADLEAGLFKHQETVERDGGELKKRWQHCLAEITIRQMQTITEGQKSEN